MKKKYSKESNYIKINLNTKNQSLNYNNNSNNNNNKANTYIKMKQKKNDSYLDTLLQGEPYGWTSYTKVGFAGDILNLGNNVCELTNDKIFCIGVSIRAALEFKNSDGISVIY